MLEKEFVPYEQALELKELNFNESCFREFHFEKLVNNSTGSEITNYELIELYGEEDVVAAPTFSQAFRWFREKFELFGEVMMYIPQEGDLDGCFTYISSISTVENYSKKPKIDKKYYKSYEEAELACLRKLIEIVKK